MPTNRPCATVGLSVVHSVCMGCDDARAPHIQSYGRRCAHKLFWTMLLSLCSLFLLVREKYYLLFRLSLERASCDVFSCCG